MQSTTCRTPRSTRWVSKHGHDLLVFLARGTGWRAAEAECSWVPTACGVVACTQEEVRVMRSRSILKPIQRSSPFADVARSVVRYRRAPCAWTVCSAHGAWVVPDWLTGRCGHDHGRVASACDARRAAALRTCASSSVSTKRTTWQSVGPARLRVPCVGVSELRSRSEIFSPCDLLNASLVTLPIPRRRRQHLGKGQD